MKITLEGFESWKKKNLKSANFIAKLYMKHEAYMSEHPYKLGYRKN